jgi:hypothetical protein
MRKPFEHAPDFELSSSFFDVEESQEEEGEAESIAEDSKIQAVTSEEEAEFIFNEIEVKDHLEMEVVDPELVAPESQIQMEFEMPLPPKNEIEIPSMELEEL